MLCDKDNIEQSVSTLAGCKNKLIGTQVVVEMSEGEQYTGILKDFTDEFVITLSYAQKMPTSEESEFILCEGTTEKVLQLRNVVRLSGSIDEKEKFKAFRMDNEISGKNDGAGEKDTEFLPWSADGDLHDDGDDLLSEVDEKGMRRACKSVWEDGWKAETMFEMNKDKVIGKSTFDESLSQYSNVEVQNCTEEQIKRAEQIAKAIECNIESKRNALLENDDEERSLDVKTEFKTENQRPAKKLQQHPMQQQQQRPQRVVREWTGGPRRVSGNTSMTGSKRWTYRGKSSGERNTEQSTTNWRSTKSPVVEEIIKEEKKEESDAFKDEKRDESDATKEEKREGSDAIKEEKKEGNEAFKEEKKEGNDAGEQQKEKFKLNPAAAPFIPNSKDLNSNSVVVTTNTSPLMSNPIPPFVQLPAALPTQGISTQNLVFYHQQPQSIVPTQIPTNVASYHQQPQAVLPAQVPSNSMSYHQQPQTVLPTQIPSNQVFYQQQSQSVLPAQLPSNPIYATYPVANSGQSFVFVSPTAPHQAVILQPGVAQHFIPVSAATFPSQNVSQHYRTVTPNGVNPQAPMPHHPTNICPPPLHPATQGMIIQSPPALLNLAMPPNCVASAPPPSFHPNGRYQQQFRARFICRYIL